MYEASCYSSENENELVICFIKNYMFLLKEGGGGGLIERERGLNKYLHLKRGTYLRGGLKREDAVRNNPKSLQ